jgi:GNAT superfamily N-acetyltransferase
VGLTSKVAELGRHFVDVVPVDVVEWRASQVVPELSDVEGVEIHLLAVGSSPQWSVLRGPFVRVASSLLALGGRCYLATVDARFGGWVWLNRAPVQRDPYSGLRIRLAPDEAYAHAMWAEPASRHLGIGGRLMSALLLDVQREPTINRVYGWVDRDNQEMQVLIRVMFGFTQVQRVSRCRLLHRAGWQVPWSDEPRFGPVSSVGRHRTR